MHGDCLSRYLAYKEACTDNIVAVDPITIQSLTSTTGQNLYKVAVRQLLDAEECLENRRWVRDKCYPDQRDRGHDIAIEIAARHKEIAEQNCITIAQRLSELRIQQIQKRNNVILEEDKGDAINDAITSPTSSEKSKKKKKKKKGTSSSPATLPLSPTIDAEEWYNEVADRKSQQNERLNRLVVFGTKVIISYLEKGATSRHKWLRNLLTVPHVIQHLTNSLAFPRPTEEIAAILENVTSMNQWRSTIEKGLRNYLALSITPRTMEYSMPHMKEIEMSLLTKVYEHNDDLTLQYALVVDMQALTIFSTLAQAMRLNVLSTSITGVKDLKYPYPPQSVERLSWIKGVVTLARFFHKGETDDFLKSHIQWQRIPRMSKDTVDDFLFYFQDLLI